MVKIGGTLGKIGNKIKDNGGAIANVATGGVYGAIKGAQSGDWGGAISSIGSAGIFGPGGIGGNPVGDATKGLSTMTGTQVNPANGDAYIQASNDLLNPVADIYSQLGQTNISGGNVDPAFRNYQMQLAQQLQQQASGQGPSLAQMQLQQATDRSLNQSMNQIRSATGANAGLAARTAALAGAQQLGSAGNASAQLRLQEQQQARAALANVAAAGRQGDSTTRAQDIGAQTATMQGKLDAAGGLAGVRGQQLGAKADVLGYQNAAQLETSRNKNQRTNTILGGIIGAGSSALGMG